MDTNTRSRTHTHARARHHHHPFVLYGRCLLDSRQPQCLQACSPLYLSRTSALAPQRYTKATQEKFEFILGWLKDWACSRLFGLGTQLPWDEKWVIESLSDSTIYMAYYTIAHHFHGEANMNGDPSASPSAIPASQLTDSVFDYIYLKGAAPADSAIPVAKLDEMRAEFEYWCVVPHSGASVH